MAEGGGEGGSGRETKLAKCVILMLTMRIYSNPYLTRSIHSQPLHHSTLTLGTSPMHSLSVHCSLIPPLRPSPVAPPPVSSAALPAPRRAVA